MAPWVKREWSSSPKSQQGFGLSPSEGTGWRWIPAGSGSSDKDSLFLPGPSCAAVLLCSDFGFPNNLVKVIDILSRSRWSCLSLFRNRGLSGPGKILEQTHTAKIACSEEGRGREICIWAVCAQLPSRRRIRWCREGSGGCSDKSQACPEHTELPGTSCLHPGLCLVKGSRGEQLARSRGRAAAAPAALAPLLPRHLWESCPAVLARVPGAKAHTFPGSQHLLLPHRALAFAARLSSVRCIPEPQRIPA